MAHRLSHRGKKHIIAAGITPSGEFHIGHLREILTGEIIHRACLRLGLESEFVFVVDSADPLRKVYNFLDPEYEKYVGHQLACIPAPDENGKPGKNNGTYSEYFLNPFLEALSKIGVNPKIIDNYKSYADGKFANAVKITCENVEQVREIIEKISGRELSDDWFPYNPINDSGSMEGLTVSSYEWPYVYWRDNEGNSGKNDIRNGEGKLPWRLDWPAKWSWLGVTCEPFGKDHGTSGGSYSTGRKFSEMFGHEPPFPLTYEWISLKGEGAMSSSTGVTIGPMDVLELVPSEILRYFIARSKPSKHLEFNTGELLLNLADEYERTCLSIVESKDENTETLSKRQRVLKEEAEGSIRYSKIDNDSEIDDSFKVPFRHLSMLVQIRSNDEDVYSALEKGGYISSAKKPSKKLSEKLSKIRNWIESDHFPDNLRININSLIDIDLIKDYSFSKDYLTELLISFQEINEWRSLEISQAINSPAKKMGLNLGEVYSLLYLIILGEKSGPKLARLLEELDKESICKLVSQAANHKTS
ncbi:MAG: Lysine--tRNA ligase [Methanobacteriota archaeon]|nr:MAG: Lysine--tRNA ligase [Euryarchaeota archaeon]